MSRQAAVYDLRGFLDTIGIEYLKACFRYENGVLFWKERPEEHFCDQRAYRWWNNRFSGKAAGSPCEGYYRIRLRAEGKDYYLSRSHLVLIFHSVDIPEGKVVDHRNGQKDDDRIENLRVVAQCDNMLNLSRYSTNKSGVKGVYRRGGRWVAAIRFRKKGIHIGCYDTKEEAVIARKAKEIELFGEFRRKDETEPPQKPLDLFPYEPTPEEEAWLNSIGSL